jgi:RNA polymerase sigma factor for flagellar operon FliA
MVKPMDRYQASVRGDRRELETRLVREYAPFVKRIALHLIQRLPATVELEDLLQAGTIGLLEAARKYSPDHGASFETFAGIRIRGAMIDEVRPMDWTPRSVNRKGRNLAETVRSLGNRLGRPPRDREVMAELGLDDESYHAALRDVAATKLVSYEAICPPGEAPAATASDKDSPDATLLRDAFKAALAQKISQLPDREQKILSMYYEDQLNFREIGEVFSISEARVCQIHAKTMLSLRHALQDWSERAI